MGLLNVVQTIEELERVVGRQDRGLMNDVQYIEYLKGLVREVGGEEVVEVKRRMGRPRKAR